MRLLKNTFVVDDVKLKGGKESVRKTDQENERTTVVTNNG